ncbi:MAG: hypothetical protein AUJ72_03670 [Candidatus Omnitrophica bacterium CG1_02_46_14]|nr:MAG: hypothetical protein AUJ72_03670 [Candidatus Omnitrophica bacterium CG1_02_46_14]
MKKKLILIGIVIFIAVSSGIDLWKKKHLNLSGTLELTEHTLGARVPGRLLKLLVDEGQTVKKGQLLATLDRFDQAKRDYDRALQLFNQGGATKQALEQAELTLQDQEILSPVDGVVLLKVREEGEILSAGAPVVDIGDRSKLWVKIYVPEGLINRVRMDQQATLTVDGIKKAFKAHVSFIAAKAEFTPRNVQTSEERITQAFAVKVMVDEVVDYLRPGVAADVQLDLKEKP